ncbi:MAG TPA: hypothetical protein VGQ83_36600 [Polyangia bacterium]|jgi:hypothetical protein
MAELSAAFQKLVTDLAKVNSWECRVEGDACIVTLPLQNGRKQAVRLATGVDHLRNPTIIFTSKVGALADVEAERALRANAISSYGALAAVGDDLVMRGSTFVGEGSLTGKELGTMIRHIATYADHMERELYGKEDRY